MLTTRVIPTSGSAFVGGVDVVAHPALAKQVIGTVSQTNTLDRQLTVWENLYFHGRLFGIGAARVASSSRRAARAVPALTMGQSVGLCAVGRHGATLDGRPFDLPLAGCPVHGRADRRSRSPEPTGPLGHLRELNEAGQTILLTTHYMEEADQLCGRVAIMDHGKILALDTPAGLKRTVGADTIVTVKASGDPVLLAEALTRGLEGVTLTRPIEGGVELHVKGGERLLARIVAAAEGGGFEVADLSAAEPSLETVFISLTGKELRE